MDDTAALAHRHTLLRNRHQQGRPAPCDHVHILLACMPKSGSSYLGALVAALPGMRQAELGRGHGRREHELALEPLVRNHDSHYIAHSHVRYSPATQRFLETFSLRVVFQVRNLYDSVVSFHDHLMNLTTVNPVTFVPDAFTGWPSAKRLMFVAETTVPWYLNLILSWTEYRGDMLLVKYADLIRDPREQLSRVAEYAGIEASTEDVDGALRLVDAARLRTRNVGGEGRGAALPAAVRRRIAHLVSYHPADALSHVL